MASSSFYKGKIDEFNNLKAQLLSLLAKVDNSTLALNKSRSYLDNIVICGEPIDKGVLQNNVSTTINDISDTIDNLISECGTKVNEYTELYYAAVEAENREARRNRSGWSFWT